MYTKSREQQKRLGMPQCNYSSIYGKSTNVAYYAELNIMRDGKHYSYTYTAVFVSFRAIIRSELVCLPPYAGKRGVCRTLGHQSILGRHSKS